MLFLILRRIRDTSEAAIDQLKIKFRTLQIRDYPGKDVDFDDFVETIYVIFQTSSVESFNRVFKDRKEELFWSADELNRTSEWPQPKALFNLASKTYSRLKIAGDWDIPAETKKKSADGYTATGTNPGSNQRSGSRPSGNLKCFNCGENHLLPDCPKPRDEDKIAKARAEFQKNKPPCRGKPKHKTDRNGRPLVRNKNGAYVLDQKKVKAEKNKSKKSEEAANAIVQALQARTAPAQTEQPPAGAPPLVPSAHTVFDPKAIRTALSPYFS
jgi:hypothetical protein